MSSQATSQCATCVRFRSPFASAPGPNGYDGVASCAAFPEGIPTEIYQNALDHRAPIAGDHGLQWSSNGQSFPEYAMTAPPPPGALGETASMQTYAMTAAALGDAQTGAMVALVPSKADAARLAVPGGEAVEELHCTIAHLGLAADIGDLAQTELLVWAADAARAWPAIEADAFAVALFNPNSEPCVTLLLNGDDLADFHDTSIAEISDLVELPSQHAPYIPHVSLVRGSGGAQAARAGTGPVVFDTLRVAFAGEINDFPLGGGPSADATSAESGEAPEVASATPLADNVPPSNPERVRFEGCPYCGFSAGHAPRCAALVTLP